MQQDNYCDISKHCKLLCEAKQKYNEALKYIGEKEIEKIFFDDDAITYELSCKEYEKFRELEKSIKLLKMIHVIKYDGQPYMEYVTALENAVNLMNEIVSRL